MARFLKRNKKKADQGKLLNLAGRCYECARCGLFVMSKQTTGRTKSRRTDCKL